MASGKKINLKCDVLYVSDHGFIWNKMVNFPNVAAFVDTDPSPNPNSATLVVGGSKTQTRVQI